MEDGEYQIMHFSPDREDQISEDPQDDIYGDIEHYDLGTEIEKANEKNRLLEENIQTLKTEKENLIEAMEAMKLKEDILKTNISSLYLTAKTELDRKSKIILELRTELEDLKFRRVGRRAWQQSYRDHRTAKMASNDHENAHDQYPINCKRNEPTKNENEPSNIIQQQQIMVIDEGIQDPENEVTNRNIENCSYPDPRRERKENRDYVKPPTIDLESDTFGGTIAIESRTDSRNSGSIDSGDHRSVLDPERSNRFQSDRSRDRDRRFGSEHFRSRSRGRQNNNDRRFDNVNRRFDNGDRRFNSDDRRFDNDDRRFNSDDRRFDNDDRRFDRNNKFRNNSYRGRDQNYDYDRNRRGADAYCNKYDDRFRDRNNRARRDYQDDRFCKDQGPQNRDPRFPDYKNRQDRTYDRRNRSHSNERNNSEKEDSSDSARYHARFKPRSRSQCDTRTREKIETSEVDIEIGLVQENNRGSEEKETKKIDCTKITYSEYKERNEMDNRLITCLEEARKELLEELQEFDLDIDVKSTNDKKTEEVGSSILSNTVVDTTPIKEDDVKSTITSQLTSISGESEGKLTKKKIKKKLNIVTQLEQKILNTPVKKYPEDQNKKNKEDERNKSIDENKISIDAFETNKKLSLLFEDIGDDGIFRRSERETHMKQKPRKSQKNEVSSRNSDKSKENSLKKNKIECAKGGKSDTKDKELLLPQNIDKEQTKKCDDREHHEMVSSIGENKKTAVKILEKKNQSEITNQDLMSDVKKELPRCNTEDEETNTDFRNSPTISNSDLNCLSPIIGVHKDIKMIKSLYDKFPTPPETIENISTEVQSIYKKENTTKPEELKIQHLAESEKNPPKTESETFVQKEKLHHIPEDIVKEKTASKNKNEETNSKPLACGELNMKVAPPISKITESSEHKSAKSVEKSNKPEGEKYNEKSFKKITNVTSKSKVPKKETKTNTDTTQPMPAKRVARSCSLYAKYLFESSSDEEKDSEKKENPVVNTKRKRAKSVCEENSEPKPKKHENRQTDVTSNKRNTPSKPDPLGLQNYKIPKKKKTSDCKTKLKENRDQSDEESLKLMKKCQEDNEKTMENRNKITSTERSTREISIDENDHKNVNKTTDNMRRGKYNKTQIEIDKNRDKVIDSHRAIGNLEETDNNKGEIEKKIDGKNKKQTKGKKSQNENNIITNDGKRYDNQGNEKNVAITVEITKPENENVNLIDSGSKCKNHKNVGEKKRDERTKSKKEIEAKFINSDKSTESFDKKINRDSKTQHNREAISKENEKRNVERRSSKKEVDGKCVNNDKPKESSYQKIKTDNKTQQNRSKSRKRKLSETSKEDTEDLKRNSGENGAKDLKKLKMQSDHKEGTQKITSTPTTTTKEQFKEYELKDKTKKIPERRKTIQNLVPSNMEQLSTTDAIRGILQQTCKPPHSSDTEGEPIQQIFINNLNKQNPVMNPPPQQEAKINSDNKIILHSHYKIIPSKVRRTMMLGSSFNSDQTAADCHSGDVGTYNETNTCQRNQSSEDIEHSHDKKNIIEDNIEKHVLNEIEAKENDNVLAEDLNITDITVEEESSSSTVIEKELSPIVVTNDKRKPRTRSRKPTPEVKELRRSKRNLKNDTSTEEKPILDSSNDNTEIKPISMTQPEPEPVCSFENILEHNNTTGVQKNLHIANTLHLTHEGEIPVLRLDDNNFRHFHNDIISKNPDANIMQLLDSMNISSMECDILKDSEEPGDEEKTISVVNTVVEATNESLTFENFLGKATSTPFMNKTVQNDSTKTDLCDSKAEDKKSQELSDNIQKAVLFSEPPVEVPSKKPCTIQATNTLVSDNVLLSTNKSSINTGSIKNEIKNTLGSVEQSVTNVLGDSLTTLDTIMCEPSRKLLSTTSTEENTPKVTTSNINENKNDESTIKTNTAVSGANQNSNISNGSINNDKTVGTTSSAAAGNVPVRRRRCRMVRIA